MSIADVFENGERSQDKAHFRNLVMIAKADGVVDQAEKRLLNEIGQKLGLTDEQISDIEKHPENYPIKPPSDRIERFEQIVELIQMAQIDGSVDDSEMKILDRIAVGIGYRDLDDVDVESILALIIRGEDTDVIITELL